MPDELHKVPERQKLVNCTNWQKTVICTKLAIWVNFQGGGVVHSMYAISCLVHSKCGASSAAAISFFSAALAALHASTAAAAAAQAASRASETDAPGERRKLLDRDDTGERSMAAAAAARVLRNRGSSR